MPLLAKADSSEEGCGNVAIAYSGVVAPPFGPPRSLPACVVGKVSLIPRMRNMWSPTFNPDRAASPPSCYHRHLGGSVHSG